MVRGTRNIRNVIYRLAKPAIIVSLILTAVSAEGQSETERNQAREAFQRGVDAFAQQRFQDALLAFQEAYRIAPHPSVRVNMANCYEQLERPVEAIFHFERFLVEAEDPDSEQETAVRSALRRLRRSVGELFLRIEPDGATVTIDGGDSFRSPVLDAIHLSSGIHEIEVFMTGYQPEVRHLRIRGAQRTELEISLVQANDTVQEQENNAEPQIEFPFDDEPRSRASRQSIFHEYPSRCGLHIRRARGYRTRGGNLSNRIQRRLRRRGQSF